MLNQCCDCATLTGSSHCECGSLNLRTIPVPVQDAYVRQGPDAINAAMGCAICGLDHPALVLDDHGRAIGAFPCPTVTL